jgi:hypothetical protein
MLLVVWAFMVLVIALTSSTSLYRFLSDHIFFFKTIRQSYFFFWITALPVAVLLVASQLRSLLSYQPSTKAAYYGAGAFVFMAHAGAFIFLITQQANVLTLGAVCLSLFSAGWGLFLKERSRFEGSTIHRAMPWIMLILIALPSAYVYHHLARHGTKEPHPYRDSLSDRSFKYQRFSSLENVQGQASLALQTKEIYYGTRHYCALHAAMDHRVMMPYVNNVFTIYDQVKFYDHDESILNELQRSWSERENVAYVWHDPALEDIALEGAANSAPFSPTADSKEFTVLHYDANTIKFRTAFDRDKFLVYNDAYHSSWSAFINGKTTPIYRSNFAFKGIRLPAGENTVEFRFWSLRQLAVEYFYIVLFSGVFMALIVLGINERRTGEGRS